MLPSRSDCRHRPVRRGPLPDGSPRGASVLAVLRFAIGGKVEKRHALASPWGHMAKRAIGSKARRSRRSSFSNCARLMPASDVRLLTTSYRLISALKRTGQRCGTPARSRLVKGRPKPASAPRVSNRRASVQRQPKKGRPREERAPSGAREHSCLSTITTLRLPPLRGASTSAVSLLQAF